MIAAADPCGPIGSRNDRVDLLTCEPRDHLPCCALLRYGEHTVDDRHIRRITNGDDVEKRFDRAQPQIARTRRIATVRFEMLKEVEDPRSIEICDLQRARRPAKTRLKELEQ